MCYQISMYIKINFFLFFPCALLRNVTASNKAEPRNARGLGFLHDATRQFGEMHMERCGWNLGRLQSYRRNGLPGSFFFSWPPEDAPPGAKDKAPGEKQMPPAPYVPLAVGASVSA